MGWHRGPSGVGQAGKGAGEREPEGAVRVLPPRDQICLAALGHLVEDAC